jgi:hypothetical protein
VSSTGSVTAEGKIRSSACGSNHALPPSVSAASAQPSRSRTTTDVETTGIEGPASSRMAAMAAVCICAVSVADTSDAAARRSTASTWPAFSRARTRPATRTIMSADSSSHEPMTTAPENRPSWVSTRRIIGGTSTAAVMRPRRRFVMRPTGTVDSVVRSTIDGSRAAAARPANPRAGNRRGMTTWPTTGSCVAWSIETKRSAAKALKTAPASM